MKLNIRSKRYILAAGAVSFLLSVPMAAQPRYVVTNLGTLGGNSSSAFAINSLGQVAGVSGNGSENHAYRTAPNRTIKATDDLGTLGGTSSAGNAINDSGQVAGSSSTGPQTHAFRSSANGVAPVVLTDLGTFSGASNSFGRGINNSGQVTGQANVTATAPCFFVFSNSVFRTAASTVSGGDNLGTLLPNNCRSATGIGINNSGVVVGDSATVLASGIPNHAFRSTGTTLVDIHPAGFTSSTATGVNTVNQVVGTVVDATNNNRCYRTAAGQPIAMPQDDIGDLGGGFCQALGINDNGHVVGTSFDGVAIRAFLYHNNVMYDLNKLIGTAPGVALTIATGINSSGQISVGGFAGADFRGFRLDPADAFVTIIIGTLSDPALGLSAGQTSSLADKLNNVLASIQQRLYKQATNQLNALINQVQTAVKTGNMSASTGTVLIDAANKLVTSIS
jgi:probable HAF family extracellular repeat protein